MLMKCHATFKDTSQQMREVRNSLRSPPYQFTYCSFVVLPHNQRKLEMMGLLKLVSIITSQAAWGTFIWIFK